MYWKIECATTCHHHQNFHSWAHPILIDLTIYFFLFFFFFCCHLSHLSVRLSPGEISSSLDRVVLSAYEFPLDKLFALYCYALRVVSVFSLLILHSSHILHTVQKTTYKRKTHCQFPSFVSSVRPSIHLLATFDLTTSYSQNIETNDTVTHSSPFRLLRYVIYFHWNNNNNNDDIHVHVRETSIMFRRPRRQYV